MPRARFIWTVWLALVLGGSGVLATALTQRPAIFQSGELTDGHHQYDVACEACHGQAWDGTERIESGCRDCHEAELAAADDSHPDRKFTDPRNASMVERLDARRCVTCHTEHRPERVRDTGLTLPPDFCAACHRDVVTDRPTHRDADFGTCASAGCHNFHDNRALYADFLERHLDEPDLLASRGRPPDRDRPAGPVLTRADSDGPSRVDAAVAARWGHSAHAKGGVNCTDCHANPGEWSDRVGRAVCAECHESEVAGYLDGRHGMRAAVAGESLAAGDARLAMKPDAASRRPGCQSCHEAHAYDTGVAAAEACLGCHDDQHSRDWRDSPHGRRWDAEIAGDAPAGSGVACATCHMPRRTHPDHVSVEHDQNASLRPVATMARDVCMHCHGLRYALEALSDEELVRANFNGSPKVDVESLEWVRRRRAQRD